MKPTPDSRPLHERFGPWGWLRQRLRSVWFGLVRRTAATDDGRAIAAESLAGLLANRPVLPAVSGEQPYVDLGVAESPTERSREAVLITARFRSGSTLLWNLFRNVDGMTAYYEPLNERRWFDPATRGTRTDATHKNVEDYWHEYDGLDELGRYFKASWNERHLYMDARSWDPDLKRYIEVLVEKAPGRPVLQFNRVDFRLPWLRHHFPGARLIHLYRHPRDQWCSTFLSGPTFPRDGRPGDFTVFDHFYLRNWAADLKYNFPFLDELAVEHPYQTFYYIWKLSYLFGRTFADYSVCFEDLVTRPDEQLPELMRQAGVENYDLDRLKGLLVTPAMGRWPSYAPAEWFRRHESVCETTLASFLGRAGVADAVEQSPLTESQMAEVRRRLAAHRANPEAAVSWEQVEAQILAKLGR